MTLTYERVPYFRGVYAIRNRHTGAMYVGCTVELKWRWQGHLSLLRAGKHDQPLLQAAWNTDGPQSFELVMLEWVAVGEHRRDAGRDLRDAERRWLVDLEAKGTTLYNKNLPRFSIPVIDETEPEPTDLTAEAS